MRLRRDDCKERVNEAGAGKHSPAASVFHTAGAVGMAALFAGNTIVAAQNPAGNAATDVGTASVSTAAAQTAENILDMQKKIDVVAGQNKAAGSDLLITIYGNGNRDTALANLRKDQAASVVNLYDQMAGGKATLPDSTADQVAHVISPIIPGINSSNANVRRDYAPYAPYATHISDLQDELKGPVQESKPVAAPRSAEIRTPQVRQFEQSASQLFQANATNSFVGSENAPAPPYLVQRIGDQTVADTVTRSFRSTNITLLRYPNDFSRLQQSGRQMANALRQIDTANTSIWSSPSFQRALQAFEDGDINRGVQELLKDPTFNILLNTYSNIVRAQIHQRALSVANANVNFRFPFYQNERAYDQYASGNIRSKFDWRPMWLDVGYDYERLLVSGVAAQLGVMLDSAGNIMTDNTGQMMFSYREQPLSGYSNNHRLRAYWRNALSIFNLPFEWAAYGYLAYRDLSMSANITMPDSSSERITFPNTDPLDGQVGMEFYIPRCAALLTALRDVSAKPPLLWPDRFGFVFEGLPWKTDYSEGRLSISNVNVRTYATISARWVDRTALILMSSVTPQYAHLLGQNHLAMDIFPLEFSFLGPWNSSIHVSPGFRADWNVSVFDFGLARQYYRQSGMNAALAAVRSDRTYEGTGIVDWQFLRFILEAKGGYVFQDGPATGNRPMSTPYGSVRLTYIMPELGRAQNK